MDRFVTRTVKRVVRTVTDDCSRQGCSATTKGLVAMPAVNVKVIEGVFTAAQKTAMIEKLTDAMVSIEGEAMRSVTWVLVEEVKSGDWGIGGSALTTDDVKALAAGAAAGGAA